MPHLFENDLSLPFDRCLDDLTCLRIEWRKAGHIDCVAMAGDCRSRGLPLLKECRQWLNGYCLSLHLRLTLIRMGPPVMWPDKRRKPRTSRASPRYVRTDSLLYPLRERFELSEMMFLSIYA